MMRLAGHTACGGKVRNVYKILVGKAEEKSLRRPRHRRNNNNNNNNKTWRIS
jgi:hypothetical protein